jgi:adenylosuccinate lyase
MREKGTTENDLLARLGGDARLPLSEADLTKLIENPIQFVGAAETQVARFVSSVETVRKKHPLAATYSPKGIL